MHAVLERVVSRISAELSGMDAEETQLSPNGRSHKWSSQQVVEHLVLGYRLAAKTLESRLSKGRVTREQSRTRLQWMLQLMVLSFGHMPTGVPALEETVPAPGHFPAMDGRELGNLIRQELETLDGVLDRCRQRFGMERVSVHPMLGPFRVDQWRRFHSVHGMHHVAQLKQVRQTVAPHLALGNVTSAELSKELQIPAQRPLT